MKTALILGATGLTGEECLKELLASPNYEKVVAVTRKPLEIANEKFQNVVVDFEKLDDYKNKIKADDVYSALGTTIGKAGSQKEFRRVDFEVPKQIAEIALWNGAKKFILVSSLGADSTSGIFYSKVKGELEDELRKMGYETVIIFRPSILLGDRKENRAGEKMGRWFAEKFSFVFSGPLKKYAGTPVSVLGKKMVEYANKDFKGDKVVENEEIISA